MIAFVRSKEPLGDARQEKYYTYFNENKIEFLFIGWDRKGVLISEANQLLFKTKYERAGKLKAILFRTQWFYFVLKALSKNRNKITVIHACDLDGALPSVIFKLFFKQKTNLKYRVIFDVFDWFSDVLKSKNNLLNGLIHLAEKFAVKHSDEIIICEPERRSQIKFKLNKEPKILRNIPYFQDKSFLVKNEKYRPFKNNKLVISYVGALSKNRLLDELILLAENEIINLNIGGFGELQLETKIKQLAMHDNVNFFGKVLYQDGLNIMHNSDMIYAMYSVKNANHYYAAPNKFYESIYLSVPILSNKGTILAEKIKNLDTGFIVDEDYNSIKKLILSVENNREILNRKSSNCITQWDNNFCMINDIFFSSEYSKMIK